MLEHGWNFLHGSVCSGCRELREFDSHFVMAQLVNMLNESS
jgi:hypothetical protein